MFLTFTLFAGFGASAQSGSLVDYEKCLKSNSKHLLKPVNVERICINSISVEIPKENLSINADIVRLGMSKFFSNDDLQKNNSDSVTSGDFAYEITVSNNSNNYLVTGLVIENRKQRNTRGICERKMLWVEPFERYSTYCSTEIIPGLFRLLDGNTFLGQISLYLDQFYIKTAYGLVIR